MKALITGIRGQDGSYMSEFLLEKGYEVYGLVRRTTSSNYQNIEHIKDKIKLYEADMLDQSSLHAVLQQVQPDEVYNFAAQSFVPTSFTQPVYTGNVTGLGVMRLLDAVKNFNPKIKFYQASSSEMFGKVETSPQNESTPFHPRSPYGVAKVYGHYATINYRESYNMYAVSGISFNHESPRRGLEFVSRKIVNGVTNIVKGKSKVLTLGNLDAKRDWGYAKDYMEAMWLMLQADKPQDYVIGTGETHSVKEFVKEAFDHVKLNWRKYVKVNKDLFRPAEVYLLQSEPLLILSNLGWKPKTTFKDLVKIMMEAELEKN
jgi:GDPmannose 4,6-dehydratase